MPIIEAAGLTKTYRVAQKKEGFLGAVRGLVRRKYKEVRAVQDVSFSIEPGEMVAFLGPNGAGKTTTLKMLSGLIYPTSGEARVLDFVPWERADVFRRRFALVMGQKNQLWWDLPAADSFQLHREIYSLPTDQFNQTVGELTEMFGVGDLTQQPVRELSLGERMKMELIAALLHRPQLLLLDEPTIGLDVVAQVTIQKCLKEYNAHRGVTMLLTSHYMRDVEALCRRVLVITHGRLIYDGALSGITEQFGNTKLVKLLFPGETAPEGLDEYGEVTEIAGPSASLKVERARVAEVLGAILDRYTVLDMSVQDPPLDQVIAHVFQQAGKEAAPVYIFMLAALPKYLKIYRVSLTERLVYRADFFLGTILRFLPTVTTILLWDAIYAGSGKDELAGFKRAQMIAYLLLVHISRMFSSMPGLAYGIARDIRDGSLKKYLLQPIDMIAYLVSYRGAHKTAYIATTALPYALLLFLFRGYFTTFPDALTLAAYVVSLLLGFLVGFFFEASLGMLGFWFLEVTSLLYIVGAVNFFVSGQMLPPDFLPQPWAGLLKSLPFQYLAYFPAMVFLGKVQGWELVRGLFAEAAWALFFVVMARVLYRRGLRHYSAFGG